MAASVTVGEFARLCHLSVKTLHHYHEIGVLVPDRIDAGSGYRRYSTDQVAAAQLVRRLRDLRLPLADVRAVLTAPDAASRDRVLRAHLGRLEDDLTRTREAVASLRTMLEPGAPAITVGYLDLPAVPALTLAGYVTRAGITAWCEASFRRLYETAATAGLVPAGPGGATYDDRYFAEDAGRVVTFVPVAATAATAATPLPAAALAAGVERADLPAGRFAVARHDGPFTDVDRTYGALGSHVAERDEAAPGPIREVYRVSPADTADPAAFRTDVCWPVRTTAGRTHDTTDTHDTTEGST